MVLFFCAKKHTKGAALAGPRLYLFEWNGLVVQGKTLEGNIRELRNVVERLLILGDDVITAQNVKDYVF